MSNRRGLVAILFVTVAMILASGLASAAASTWTLQSSQPNGKPPAGFMRAATHSAVPNFDGCPPPWSNPATPPPNYNPDGCWGNQPTSQRIYAWSETGSQLWAMEYYNNIWFPLNPSFPSGAPTAREGACLAWSGQTSSDNGHRLGEQTLILFGGVLGDGTYSKEVNIYNIVNNSWEFRFTSLSPSPVARAYMQCARFSSSGGGQYEYNGIVMSGGYNWMYGGALNDIWVFCDHPGSGESDILGCGATTHQWVQFAYTTQDCLDSGRRYGAAIQELNTRPDPLHNHGYDDEFLIWGGFHDSSLLRQGTWIRWVSNNYGYKAFSCTFFSDYDGGGGVPPPLIYPAVGYRPPNLLPGLLGMIIYGGWTGSADYGSVSVMNWEISTGRIYYYAASPVGTPPAARNGAIFPCHYNDFPATGGCGTPITYMMFGGRKLSTPGANYDDTWTAYVS